MRNFVTYLTDQRRTHRYCTTTKLIKMKKIFVLLFLSNALFAQNKMEWGLKAGLQLSRFRGNDVVLTGSVPRGATTNVSPTVGYAVGAYFKTTESVFLQGEVMLSAKGANIKSLAQTTTVQYTQFDIPLSLGYRYKMWEVSGGPLVSVQLFDNGELKKFLTQLVGKEPSFSVFVPYTFGYQLGAAARFGKASIGVRYLTSIMPVTSQSIAYTDINADPQQRQAKFEQRSGVWQFTLGLRLN